MTAVLRAEEPSARYLAQFEPTLVRWFELLATAPGGIARLRGLLVTLAVRGLLVRQTPSDEPALELVRRIAKACGRTPPSFTVDGLPEGWARVAFGDYANEINTGPFGSLIGKGDYVDGGVPLVNPSHMRQGRIVAEANVSVSEDKAVELSSYRLRAGDIVFARRGEVGRTALVTEAEHDWLCGTGSFFARFHTDADREYVQLVFASPATRAYLGGEAVGSTMVNLNQRALRSAAIDLPPLAVQHRIVARVEELMKLCDALVQSGRLADEQHARLTSTLFDALAASESAHALAENWERVAEHFDILLDRPEAIDSLEQTILQLAVRGFLVSQIAAEESAPSLLDRLRVDRDRETAIGKMKHDRPLSAVGEDEHPFRLPVGWCWTRLGAAGVTSTGGTPPTGRSDYFGTDVAYVKPGSLGPKGVTYAEEGLSESGAKLIGFVEPPAVLMVCIGGSIGKAALATRKCAFNQQINAVRPLLPTMAAYLLIALSSTDFQLQVLGKAGTCTLPIISKGKWEQLLIPMPPLSEQHRIVARVEELRRLCAQLRDRLTDARRAQSQLAEALIAEVAK